MEELQIVGDTTMAASLTILKLGIEFPIGGEDWDEKLTALWGELLKIKGVREVLDKYGVVLTKP